MVSLSEVMRSLGGAGAVANARRACDERVRSHDALEMQLAGLAPVQDRVRGTRVA